MDRFLGQTTSAATASSSVLAVAACGGGAGSSDTQTQGFPSSYVAPSSNYVAPNARDPSFEILKTPYSEPYWVTSLEMDQWDLHIKPMLEDFDRVIHYTFPTTLPEYDTFELTGWGPVTEEIKIATHEIFGKVEDILDITFVESNDPKATNVIALSISNQVTTAGFSYFPNNHFEIGMDVFIANGYSNPSFLNESTITNYDYEVLVHEIGHALGLKHPFEANGANNATLSAYEDNTRNTAMSYNDYSATYTGTLRPLDWVTLTNFYGVKPTHNAGDDIYEFSSSGATFIIDGAGIDTINAASTSKNVVIDLRPGAHSYLGIKSNYITDINQLTISHSSDIENVITGSGNDIVIGTDSDNVILTGSGSDTIYAGGGADTITAGTGSDRIDLSELVQSRDTVLLNASSSDLGIDTLYGFSQGALGDILDFSEVSISVFEMLPLVVSGSAPTANFSGGILSLVGSDVSNPSDLLLAFQAGGGLETLSIDSGESALIVSAGTQATGEDQHVFAAESSGGEISILQLATLQGNSLDIDRWHVDNFSSVA